MYATVLSVATTFFGFFRKLFEKGVDKVCTLWYIIITEGKSKKSIGGAEKC